MKIGHFGVDFARSCSQRSKTMSNNKLKSKKGLSQTNKYR